MPELETIQNIIKIIKKSIEVLEEEELIEKYADELNLVDKAQTVGGYKSPEPGDLPEAGAKLLARVYASCRQDGGDKEKCAKIAWSIVNRQGYKTNIKDRIFKEIQKSLCNIIEIKKNKVDKREGGLNK